MKYGKTKAACLVVALLVGVQTWGLLNAQNATGTLAQQYPEIFQGRPTVVTFGARW